MERDRVQLRVLEEILEMKLEETSIRLLFAY